MLEAALSVVEDDGRFGSDLSPRLVVLRGDRRIEAPMQRTGPGLYRLAPEEGMLFAPSLEPYRVEVHTGAAGAAGTVGPGRTIFFPARDELRPGAPDIAALAELAAETSGLFHETATPILLANSHPCVLWEPRRTDFHHGLLAQARQRFEDTGSLVDLVSRVESLTTGGASAQLCKFSELLFERTHSLEHAEDV